MLAASNQLFRQSVPPFPESFHFRRWNPLKLNRLLFSICAGNPCHWLWWTICYFIICNECIHRCTNITLYCWTNKTVLRFHLYISCDPFDYLLVLQWFVPINIFVVVFECSLWNCNVHLQWIPLFTNRIARDSSWLHTTRYQGWFMKWLKYVPWWFDCDKWWCNHNTSTKKSRKWHNQSHGTCRELRI